MNNKNEKEKEVKVEELNIPWNEQEGPLETVATNGDSICESVMALTRDSVTHFLTIVQFFQKINCGFFEEDKGEAFSNDEHSILDNPYYCGPDHFDEGKQMLGKLIEKYINPESEFIVIGVMKRLALLPNHIDNAVGYAFEMINSQKESVEDWFPF